MIDVISVLTSGTTGLVFGAAVVMMLTNMCKAGWFGAISRWINGAVDKTVYGKRVLTVAVGLSCLVNALQWATMPAVAGNVWGYLLRVLGCSLIASGGYEYIKTVTRAFPGEEASDDVDKNQRYI